MPLNITFVKTFPGMLDNNLSNGNERLCSAIFLAYWWNMF